MEFLFIIFIIFGFVNLGIPVLIVCKALNMGYTFLDAGAKIGHNVGNCGKCFKKAVLGS
ncbi:hypothetical protein [Bacillus gobiensis]|uniref:hypothetical protein n=1 Tax=Bacillus gobiensis TaxID=1441095 RepID=UPI003D2214FA